MALGTQRDAVIGLVGGGSVGTWDGHSGQSTAGKTISRSGRPG